MASASADVEAINDAMQLKGVGAKYWRDRLVSANLIQGGQGRPLDTPLADVATILLAVMVGKAAAAQPHLAARYGRMTADDGDTLGAALARFLGDPHEMLELRVDTETQAAAILHKDDKGGVVETVFLPDVADRRENFTRVAILGANGFTTLALALAAAAKPARPPATGRTRRRRRRRSEQPMQAAA